MQHVTPLPLCCADYNGQEKQRQFEQQWLTCGVCLSSKRGSEFERVLGCGHPFCRQCLREHFRIQIESGCASQLRCPEEKCGTQVVPTQVHAQLQPGGGRALVQPLLCRCAPWWARPWAPATRRAC